jgi:alpha-beta hydrolase superfamily lysophospholipase
MTIRMDEGPLNRGGSHAAPFARILPALYTRTATPKAPKAALALVHGYADHSGRYLHVMEALAEQGIAVCAIDLRGHGKAEGRRGFCTRFAEYFEDFAELPALLDALAPGAPQFLFGHSFGALAATLSLLEPNAPSYRGLLLSSPFFGLGMEPPRIKVWAGKLASRIAPTLGFPSGLAGKDMTHDRIRAEAYDADPLCFKAANPRWFTESMLAQKAVREHAARLTLPVYLAFGAADRVASPRDAREVFEAMGSKDKTLVPLADQIHEILNEPSWRETTAGFARFIHAHL